MSANSDAQAVQDRVLDFYRTLAFNRHASAERQASDIDAHDPTAAYPVLRPLLGPGVRVLEIGSGTGWFGNSIARHHRARVTGVDLNPDAVDFARRVAALLGVTTEFACADLFTYQPEQAFPVVVSLGVLHHTHDCAAAVRRVCADLLAPGGHALIGLYHRFGRQPFLAHFQQLQRRGASEAELLRRYRQLHTQLVDDTHALSWFRDQVLHPHESQHTLAEMRAPVAAAGCAIVATSLNDFAPLGQGLDEVCRRETELEAVGQERLRQGRYYPGFFLFLVHKPPA